MHAPSLTTQTGSSTASTPSSAGFAHVWHEPPPFSDSLDFSPNHSAPSNSQPYVVGVDHFGRPTRSGQSLRLGSAPAVQSSWAAGDSRMHAHAHTHGTHSAMGPTHLQALEAQMAANIPSACHTAPQFHSAALGTPPAMESPTMSIAERPASSSEVDMCAQPLEPSDLEHVRVLAQPAHCPPILARKVWHIKQFRLEKVLYVGTISRVLRAVDIASGMTVALKVYKRHKLSDMEKYQVAREIRMHSELCHNNIISLYCAWKDANFIYVAVEWAPNGDIFHVMKSWGKQGVSEGVVMTTIFRPLLSALSYVHSRGLIHRDIKPENILVGDNYNIKLSDFGLSINQYHEVANTRLGTLNYIPPEILKCPYKNHPLENKGSSAVGYNNKVDVWSLGVLAYELLTGSLPFCSSVMLETLQKIMINRVDFPETVSVCARDFISLCLQSDPAARPTVEQLQEHPWVLADYPTDMS